MKASDVVKALKQAVRNRITTYPLIHHSDRGLQYCSGLYQSVLKENNITASMTDGYDCYQNALAERVNGILKQEFLLHRCKTFEDLRQLVKEAVQTYNTIQCDRTSPWLCKRQKSCIKKPAEYIRWLREKRQLILERYRSRRGVRR